ncbi:tyrosine-protein phosphatase [Nocardioides sp. zg-DK7169]|uniref:tyrosine-protein phosphatase n=1 Tax=Nocardioides sp. zg-DK7169 TaxID=2736600 RepID=UPI0015542895|nr:tyrosine-protein phosphatase [Nocardioides sp. zg-DK7169]NPC97152.1 tyrosine-protein phosphatase [Nocardioides sp. zg-DK7169]
MGEELGGVGPRAAEELVRLGSADNFRDVAGPGYRAGDGTPLRGGVYYRSNELQLTDEDAASIAALGVSAVHDLRTLPEVEHRPSVDVPGATRHHVDVLGIPLDAISELADAESAVALMERVYLGFVGEPTTREALGSLLTSFADDGVHLFHCSAGKDRTGWTAALLLHIAGVADDLVLADYLLTNTRAEASRAATLRLLTEAQGPEQAAVFEPVLLADAAYLHTSYAAVEERYGTRERYLLDGLGLEPRVLTTLRERLRA